MKNFSAFQIYELLKNQVVSKALKGTISVKFADVEFNVETKDIMGGILQEWFGEWLKNNCINFETKHNTQEFPDFILYNGDFLEVKTFDSDASPNFDVANFDAYTRSLLSCPQRLDADYLVFSYKLTEKYFEVTNVWLKKVWEITGPSQKNCLNLQVKQGIPVNIRLKTWYGRTTMFKNRREFVVALNDALNKFKNSKFPNWLTIVSETYKNTTGNAL